MQENSSRRTVQANKTVFIASDVWNVFLVNLILYMALLRDKGKGFLKASLSVFINLSTLI